MTAYYNEIDPYAAQWLRNLIAVGHIAPGDVDERSISDVRPDDLRGYTQCHFFAGIGVWSYALRRAGWPDDRTIWTGSCPCQPFSAAGAGAGFADERHLWPHWYHLISVCQPSVVFGEQVASKDANPWIDLVSDDMEGLGYGVGAVPFPAAGIGAPHIRDRLYWVADATDERCNGEHTLLWQSEAGWQSSEFAETTRRGKTGRMANDIVQQRPSRATSCDDATRWHEEPATSSGLCGDSGLAHSDDARLEGHGRPVELDGAEGRQDATGHGATNSIVDNRNPTNGHWRDADWLFCRDGKWRPVEPSTFPLAHGSTGRVGRLRAYGNAIVAQAAEEFIRAYLEPAVVDYGSMLG